MDGIIRLPRHFKKQKSNIKIQVKLFNWQITSIHKFTKRKTMSEIP